MTRDETGGVTMRLGDDVTTVASTVTAGVFMPHLAVTLGLSTFLFSTNIDRNKKHSRPPPWPATTR